MPRYTPLLAICLAVVGCVSAQVIHLGPPKAYDPIEPDRVQVFLTPEDVPGAFEKLALIKLKGDASWTNETEMIAKAKREAAQLGANGVILGPTNEPSAGAQVAASIFGVSVKRRGETVAIRFDPDGLGIPNGIGDQEFTRTIDIMDGSSTTVPGTGMTVTYRSGPPKNSILAFDGVDGVSGYSQGPFEARQIQFSVHDLIYARVPDGSTYVLTISDEGNRHVQINVTQLGVR